MLRNRQAPSRASPQTLCQKCLKKDESIIVLTSSLTDIPVRHYSYECKATIQDRPYRARPSRSQQLANPKLAPKLNSDQPNDLLRKEGVADELLAKAEAERRQGQDDLQTRSRSVSSSSVATISTRDSISPDRRDTVSGHDSSRKRRRRSSSSSSGSLSTSESIHGGQSSRKDKNTRRRHSTASPSSRGRKVRHESSKDRRTSPRSRD